MKFFDFLENRIRHCVTIYYEINIKMNPQQECPICLCEITSENLFVTKCGHAFCFTCLKKSLERSSECPCCRGNISHGDSTRIKADVRQERLNDLIAAYEWQRIPLKHMSPIDTQHIHDEGPSSFLHFVWKMQHVEIQSSCI